MTKEKTVQEKFLDKPVVTRQCSVRRDCKSDLMRIKPLDKKDKCPFCGELILDFPELQGQFRGCSTVRNLSK